MQVFRTVQRVGKYYERMARDLESMKGIPVVSIPLRSPSPRNLTFRYLDRIVHDAIKYLWSGRTLLRHSHITLALLLAATLQTITQDNAKE
jgi:hypothetical protein